MGLRTRTISANQAYEKIISQAAASRKYCEGRKTDMQQATVSADVVLSVIQHTQAVLSRYQVWTAAPGIADIAKEQEADPAYDVAAEYITFRNAMRALRDNLIALFPKDGNDYLLYQKLNADGSFDTRTFTAAQLAPAITLLDAVINAVEVV